jgi:hypothetical protein
VSLDDVILAAAEVRNAGISGTNKPADGGSAYDCWIAITGEIREQHDSKNTSIILSIRRIGADVG